jgi:hypothetical protein
MDDRFGFEQINVTSKWEALRGIRSYVASMPRAVRLISGPRDAEIVDDVVPDGYVEVTAYGDTRRTAVWSPEISDYFAGIPTPPKPKPGK